MAIFRSLHRPDQRRVTQAMVAGHPGVNRTLRRSFRVPHVSTPPVSIATSTNPIHEAHRPSPSLHMHLEQHHGRVSASPSRHRSTIDGPALFDPRKLPRRRGGKRQPKLERPTCRGLGAGAVHRQALLKGQFSPFANRPLSHAWRRGYHRGRSLRRHWPPRHRRRARKAREPGAGRAAIIQTNDQRLGLLPPWCFVRAMWRSRGRARPSTAIAGR